MSLFPVRQMKRVKVTRRQAAFHLLLRSWSIFKTAHSRVTLQFFLPQSHLKPLHDPRQGPVLLRRDCMQALQPPQSIAICFSSLERKRWREALSGEGNGDRGRGKKWKTEREAQKRERTDYRERGWRRRQERKLVKQAKPAEDGTPGSSDAPAEREKIRLVCSRASALTLRAELSAARRFRLSSLSASATAARVSC